MLKSTYKNVGLFLFLILFLHPHSFAANIPTEGLLLEYKFAGNTNDTSWRNRETTVTNLVPTYDLGKNLNFWKYNNGRMVVTNWWSTDEFWKYTFSFWYRWTQKANYAWLDQVIISDSNSRVFEIKRTDNKCYVFWTNFDCLWIQDDKWHHFILRKNGRYNKVYLDGKKIVDIDAVIWGISYNLNIWGTNPNVSNLSDSSVTYSPWTYYYSVNGSLANFRMYSRELTVEEMSELFNELKYVTVSDFNTSEYTLPLQTTPNPLFWTGAYTMAFTLQTNTNQRVNESNWTRSTSYADWKDGPQTIFSTMNGNEPWKINLTLDKNYLCGTPYGTFSCTSLQDQATHNFLIRRNSTSFEVWLDNVKVFTSTLTNVWQFWTIFTQANTSASIDTRPNTIYYSGCPTSLWLNQNGVFMCNSRSWFLWIITNQKWYAWYMADNQVNETFVGLGNQSTFTIGASLKEYVNNIMNIQFKFVPQSEKKDTTLYQYSWDNLNFTTISSWSLIETTGLNNTVTYDLSLDTTSRPDGTINLYLRNQKNGINKFIARITVIKDTSNLQININQPNTSSSQSKYISASFWSGSLSMSLTRWNICNSTLTFEKYTDVTFNSSIDNGIKICYKWVETWTNKEVFKLSNPIEGIDNGWVYYDTGTFWNYRAWKYSKNVKVSDSTYWILWFILAAAPTNKREWYNMVDINWDWLIDVMYISQNSVWTVTEDRRAIYVNNWDYTFVPVYKCVSITNVSDTAQYKVWFYGDCAWTEFIND